MFVSIAIVVAQPSRAAGIRRPNVVWIISEDNSKHYLKHFDPAGAPTPNIEAMARHGLTFDRAFSNSPVCSVARTTLITSCYAPRIGTQYHRKINIAALPTGVQMFPAYLRAAGYYTTNNSKEDYNAVKSANLWSESSRQASWKNRPDKSTSFFHVQSIPISHESSLHFPASDLQVPTVTDQAAVRLQPYLPDTPVLRYTRARYHDRIMAVDQVVGKIIGELHQAGELENTFVFYFGDHGGVLPRSKGYLYESGLHVPLVIRVPENFRSLAGRDLASRCAGFVEFVDYGPTTLALAGLDPPAGIDGKPFLGPAVVADEVDARDETFGYADRFDEKYDLVRSLRQGRFKYIRNFEPFLPDGLQNNYRYKSLAYQQWRQLHREGKLNALQSQFFEPKSVEALYDLDADPDEVANLADQPKYANQLSRMRARLSDRLKAMPDLSFIPEALLVTEMADPVGFGRRNQQRLSQLIDTANLALLPFEDAQPKLQRSLASEDPWIRYWALVTCSSFAAEASSLLPRIEQRLVDSEPLVVARAVEFMAIVGGQDPRPWLYRSFQRATNEAEALQILNTAVYLNDFHGDQYPIDPARISFLLKFDPNSLAQRRLDYLQRQ